MSRTGVQRAHMRDFFLKGKSLTIEMPGSPGFELWIQKPGPLQFEDANRKGRVAAARIRSALLRADSVEHEALMLEIENMDLDTVVKELLGHKKAELERQAFNDVLFSEEYGSDWGKDGIKYTDLLDAMVARSNELAELAGDENLRASELLKDEEYKRLDDLMKLFQEEVEARFHDLQDAAEQEQKVNVPIDELRKKYLTSRVDIEGQTEWFTEFKMWSAYYSVRDPDDHSAMYFANPEEFKSMPAVVQRQIIDVLDSLEATPDPKSLTPESS